MLDKFSPLWYNISLGTDRPTPRGTRKNCVLGGVFSSFYQWEFFPISSHRPRVLTIPTTTYSMPLPLRPQHIVYADDPVVTFL